MGQTLAAKNRAGATRSNGFADQPAQPQGTVVLLGIAAAVHQSSGRAGARAVRHPWCVAGGRRFTVRQRLRADWRGAGPLAATQPVSPTRTAMAVRQPVDRFRRAADLCSTGLSLTVPYDDDGD